MKLSKPGPDGYKKDVCAASRCGSPSELIDATNQLSDYDVPLCTRCWIASEDQRDNFVETKIEVVAPTAEVEIEDDVEDITSGEVDASDVNSESFKLF